MHDSLQTARLRLNAQTQKKMDRLVGETGIDVIDDLGCVGCTMVHADALRKTYGRTLRYDLDTTQYMKPQETWGRMPAKLLCGDFFQLPPVPVSSSLLAPGGKAISEEAWQAIEKTQIGSQGSDASQLTATDPRLRAARGWYESAHDLRVMLYAMHAQTRLTAYDLDKV